MKTALCALLLAWVAVAAAPRAGFAAPSVCGDAVLDGVLDSVDVARLRAVLAGAGAPPTLAESARFNTHLDASLPGIASPGASYPDDVSVVDVTLLRRDLAGLWPEVAAVCPAGSREDCCSAHAGVGCNEPEIVSCVCALDATCCTTAWGAACAARVTSPDCASVSLSGGLCEQEQTGRATQTWLAGSVFRTATGWFSSSTHRRVFVGDVNADGRADVVGIAFNGDVWVSTSTGTAFGASALWRSASVFQTANGWFDTSFHERVFLADVTGDGRADLVGVASNGDVWVSESTGAAFAASHLAQTSPFSTPAFFALSSQPRLWLADVSADGRADVVGIAENGDIHVVRATGSGTSASFAADAIWRAGSIFQVAADWFLTIFQPRVFLGDVTGDGAADFVGVAINGDLWASEADPGGLSFVASHLVGGSALGDGTTGSGWFGVASHPRVFVADVNADARQDLVAISDGEFGDGDVWAELATGSLSSAAFRERILLHGSVFRTGNGWFDTSHAQRVFAADVSGDGRADLAGIANNGDVWVARSAEERGSSDAPLSARGVRDYLLPSERIEASRFDDSRDITDGGGRPRLFAARVSDDPIADLIAIAPGVGDAGDGDVLWKAALPTVVTSATAPTKAAVDAGGGSVQIAFSRSVDAATLPAAALRATEAGVAHSAAGVAVTGPLATFTASYAPRPGMPTDLWLELASTVQDRFGERVDGNGDLHPGGRFRRAQFWRQRLLAAARRIEITTYPGIAAVPGSSGYGYCPEQAPYLGVTTNPPRARVLVLAGGGSCADTSECRAGQLCSAGFCGEPGAGDATAPLVISSADLIGFNPGRLRALLAARYGIPPERVIAGATHAHWAPRQIKLFVAPYYDDRETTSPATPYSSWVEEQIATAVGDALHDLREVDLGSRSASIALGYNRRSAPPIDHEARDLLFRTPAGRVRAELFSHAVHPVYVGSGPLDADYPGIAAGALESVHCPTGGCTALFLNGAAGDIDPSYSSSVHGSALASALAGAAETSALSFGMQIDTERSVAAYTQGISSCNNCTQYEPPRLDGRDVAWDAESTAIAIGRPNATPAIELMTVPGEPYTRLQLRLKASFPSALLLGYSDGYLGYFADDLAYTEGNWVYGRDLCFDGTTSVQNGPTFFDHTVHPTPGEAMVDHALDALTNRLLR